MGSTNVQDQIEYSKKSTKTIKVAMERAAKEFDGILNLMPKNEKQYFMLETDNRIKKLYQETLEELQNLKNVLEELQGENSQCI